MEDTIECQKCKLDQNVFIESEDAGDGSEHERKCDGCGEIIKFELSYLPVLSVIE